MKAVNAPVAIPPCHAGPSRAGRQRRGATQVEVISMIKHGLARKVA